MMSSLGSITRALGIAFSIATVTKFGKEAIDLASDLQEVDNVVSKAFGDMRSEMDDLAESAIKNLGMSRLMAYQTGSTFMSMGKSMLDSRDDAKEMALELTKLTANMSSFFNVSQDLASIALKSIYTGETETLKQYGVVMTEVNLKQFALSKGISKAYSEMSQSEKVMLRYQYVMSQLSYIGDDFIDTQDSWANQTRVLSEQWKELLTILGNGLVSVLTPVVKGLNSIVSSLISVANTIGTILTDVFGIQAQQMSSNASAAEELANGYSDATDSMEQYADATKRASKTAKGALATFDDLNVLQKESGTSSGGSASRTEIVDVKAQSSAIDQVQKKYNKFFKYLESLRKDFIKGFNVSAWKSDLSGQLDSIKNSASSVKEAIIGIFADTDVLLSVDRFLHTVSYSFGSILASAGSIGLSIGNNLIGGFNKYIQENSDEIRTYLISMFDIGTDIADIGAKGLEALAEVFSVFGDENGQEITANFIQIFSDMFFTITEIAGKFARDVSTLLVSPFVDNQEAIKTALDGMLESVSMVTSTCMELTRQLGSGLTSLYDEHIHPLYQNVTEGVSILTEKFLDFWNTYLQPFLDNVTAGIEDTYQKHLKPTVDSILEIVGYVIDIVNVLWTNYLVPLISWITENILPVLLPILDLLATGVKNTIDIILDVFNVLLSGIKFILSAIKLLLTKDTDDTFRQTIQSAKDFVNSIITLFENMANNVIDGINKIISGLNGIGFDLPDWMGGKSFKLDIPKVPRASLPRLANGGITTGRTLAEIGEAGREAVLPLENNTGWMDDFASRLVEKMNPDKPIILMVDGKRLAQVSLPYLKGESYRLGLDYD